MGTASHWYFRDLHIDTECQRKGQKRQLDQISYSSRYVIKYTKHFFSKGFIFFYFFLRTYVRLGLTKHFGSLTLGSFMILTFGWLNSILTFTKERLEFSYQRRMSQKSCFNSIYKCFFWFFKKYIRFNTKIAYMMVAYKGNSFISSGRYMSQIIDEYYDIFSEISALTALFAFGLNLVCSFIPSLIFYYVFEYIPWYGLYLSSSLHPAMV